MLLYYITDRRALAGTDAEQRAAVLCRVAEAARAGVDYIQLREKDLAGRELERLAREAVQAVRDNSGTTRLLINSRGDVAIACGADGVHLASGELAAPEVRALWRKSAGGEPIIGVSAHSVADVREAKAVGADFAVLAPIFEKVETGSKGIGIEALREACGRESSFAVLALGGVNLTNAGECLQAGAAGVAGIRLFQTSNVAEIVRQLREV